MEEQRKETRQHSIAVHAFDGETTEIYQADEIRFFAPTKTCVQFWATIIACFVAIGVGVAFMLIADPAGKLFPIGNTLLALACGVLIPG